MTDLFPAAGDVAKEPEPSVVPQWLSVSEATAVASHFFAAPLRKTDLGWCNWKRTPSLLCSSVLCTAFFAHLVLPVAAVPTVGRSGFSPSAILQLLHASVDTSVAFFL